jgi:hypothetical protein
MIALHFMPYGEIERLTSDQRIDKLLSIVRDDRIVLLEGKLKPHEETALIARTMAAIDESFRGIEIAGIRPHGISNDQAIIAKLRTRFINAMLGDRKGFTIIGPATVVKEIKQDPDKILLFTNETKKK